MKGLRVLYVVIPILAVLAWLAGVLGSDAGFQVFGLGFLIALLGAWLYAICLLCREMHRRFGTPRGWRDAQELYPLPNVIQGPRIRRNQFLKDTRRRWRFPCALRIDNRGVLVEDGNPLPLFSFGKMFIPWESLENPQQTRLPWYVSLVRPVAVELQVQRAKLSLAVTMDVWREHFAPHFTSPKGENQPGASPNRAEPGDSRWSAHER